MPDKCQGRYLAVCDEEVKTSLAIKLENAAKHRFLALAESNREKRKRTSLAIKLENAAKHRFLALAERHMSKREGILFSEQAPTQYFFSFCRMAKLVNIVQLLTDKIL